MHSGLTVNDFTMSRHAVDRALDMRLTAAQIRRVLEHPNSIMTRPSDGRWLMHRWPLTAVVDPRAATVVTFLTHDGASLAECAERPMKGRSHVDRRMAYKGRKRY